MFYNPNQFDLSLFFCSYFLPRQYPTCTELNTIIRIYLIYAYNNSRFHVIVQHDQHSSPFLRHLGDPIHEKKWWALFHVTLLIQRLMIAMKPIWNAEHVAVTHMWDPNAPIRQNRDQDAERSLGSTLTKCLSTNPMILVLYFHGDGTLQKVSLIPNYLRWLT